MNEVTLVWGAVGGCAAAWMAFLYRWDKYDPEPLGTVVRVGVLGGLMSVILAGIFNGLFDSAMGYEDWQQGLGVLDSLIMSIFVGLNEEGMKFLATVLLVRKLRAMDESVDALLYSTAVALGFAAFENLAYTFDYGLVTLAVRQLTAVPLHIGVAVIWGYGIARSRFVTGQGLLAGSFPYLLAAAGVHALYDFFCFVITDGLAPLSLLTSFLIAGFLVWLVVRRMRRLQAQTPFVTGAICTRCGLINVLDANYCAGCGEPIDRSFFKICSACHVKAPASEDFCAFCGGRLDD